MRFRLDQWMAFGVDWEVGKALIAQGVGISSRRSAYTQTSLPSMLRRRITAIGQLAFQACCAISIPTTARFIFCSRHGEFKRTLGILNSLVLNETVSPSEFSLSVHNALAGLLSIFCHNTLGHTTISAGADSFGCALLEAAACLITRPGEPALLVYFDLLPEPYAEIGGSVETGVALALLLQAPRGDADDLILDFAPAHAAISTTLSASGQALDFLRFLQTGEREGKSVGERMEWRWRHA
jgi:hypothetical protein